MKKIFLFSLFFCLSIFVYSQGRLPAKNPVRLADTTLVSKTILVDYSGAYVFSQPTDITTYKTYDVDETVYIAGDVINVSGYEFVSVYLEKTASTADDLDIKVCSLTGATETICYQQTSQSAASGGVVSVESNIYQFAKEAGTFTFLIPVSGSLYIRLDMQKDTDAGTASTVETQISKIK